MSTDQDPVDPRDRLRRIPVADRPNKVSSGDFATASPREAGASFRQFYESLPHILAADSLRAVAGGLARDRPAGLDANAAAVGTRRSGSR